MLLLGHNNDGISVVSKIDEGSCFSFIIENKLILDNNFLIEEECNINYLSLPALPEMNI